MEGNRSGIVWRRVGGRFAAGSSTGVSTAAVSGSAAVLGVILSRKFGLGVKTDGFFAAYGVYLALVLVAELAPRDRAAAIRRGARRGPARARGLDVGGRPRARARALVAGRASLGRTASPTCSPPTRARSDQAAKLLPWIVVSAVAQIFGGSLRARSPRSTTTTGRRSASRSARSLGVVVTIVVRRPRRDRLRLGPRGERRGHARRAARRARLARRLGPAGRPRLGRGCCVARRGRRVAVRAAGAST